MLKHILFPEYWNLDPEVLGELDNAAVRLGDKLSGLSVKDLNISEYNQRYLQDYIDNYPFYISIYTQLLIRSVRELNKPVYHSTLIDYGGGCGILSFLAKEAGFKTVVYNDIYKVSTEDIRVISDALDIPVDHVVHGDVGDVVDYIHSNSLSPDLICSMDVLEHIYSLENWFKTISSLKQAFSIVFMTSANGCNPLIKRRLQQIQYRDEYVGNEKAWGWKERDATKPFLSAREDIIVDFAPDMEMETVNLLVKGTRGLIKDDIEDEVRQYLIHHEIQYQPAHPTNTCDPFTGNGSENILDPGYLKNLVEGNGMEFQICSNFYSDSDKQLLNLVKRVINGIIFLSRPENLFFSPAYTLIARKRV